MAAAANQYEPVAKIDSAPRRPLSDPSSAEIGWPLAMHLPQHDRSGSTPTTAQLQLRAIRKQHEEAQKPERTASVANQYRDRLIAIYGEDRGKKVKYAEACQLGQYGRQAGAEELKGLFPVR